LKRLVSASFALISGESPIPHDFSVLDHQQMGPMVD